MGPARAAQPEEHEIGRAREPRDPLDDYIEARAVSAERQAEREATDLEEIRARAQERRMLRWLVAMVVLIVVGGFAISIIGLLVAGGSGAGH